MKRWCLFVVLTTLASAGMAQSTAQHLEAQGARVVAKATLEKLLLGARVIAADTQGATRSWIHQGRNAISASLQRAGGARPLNGAGTANVDQNGAYCVRIEWPRTEESWCRRILSLNGGYYAVSDDPQTEAMSLQIVQPDAGRLTTLGRMWSLMRITSGTAAIAR